MKHMFAFKNLSEKQAYIIAFGIIVLALMVSVFFGFLILGKETIVEEKEVIEEKVEESEKDFVEQTTAPSESLLTPEEEEELMENLTAPH